VTLISAADLAEDIAHFVAFKRAMGHSYRRSELTLKSFQRAVEQRAGLHAKVPFDVVLHEWLILYCTGLRLGEAVRLQLSDVDLEQLCFIVRESKGRTRIVPFLDDLARELSDCLQLRRRILEATAALDPGALLLRNSGQALSVVTASEAIRRLLRREGLKPARGRKGPRPYEFRHAYAVHRLTAWYHEGVDIHARLPWLSAYMGHVDVLGTQVYLRATPELMRLASQRFAQHWHHLDNTP
jgi:integrase